MTHAQFEVIAKLIWCTRGSSRARDPQADKNNIWRAFLKRDFATEPQPTYPKTNPTDPGRPGFAPTATKKARKGPNGARASAAARDPRREQDNKPPATPRAVTTTAAATQPSPRVSRPARTGEPTYRTTRSRDRSGSRSGSRERKPPSEREAQTTKGRPWQTPRAARPRPDPSEDPPLKLAASSSIERH
jgi:hypothetical protein